MKRYYFITTINVLLIFITIGCTNTSKTNEIITSDTDHLLQVKQQQFESESMIISEIGTQHFEEEIKCNGYITAPTNGMAQISTQISGIVKTINCSLGDYVKKGQILCAISTNELIALQQDFTETSAILKRLKADYERNQALFNEKIGAEKDLIAIEGEYKAMLSKYQSLKLQLELLKLNVSKIEDGKLYSGFPIIAPIDGYITNLYVVLGQFIEQQKTLIEIVDISKLQLQLSVFENDLKELKKGQKIQFNSLKDPKSIHNATLTSVGKTINLESKTIQCIAKINNINELNFINNSYIEARIIVKQRKTKALPNEAILKSGKDYYVFVVEKSDEQIYYLRKEEVKIGYVSKNYTEIINSEGLTKVVTKGLYNLQSE